MHNFLLGNANNGGVLDLMLQYLKAVGQRFTKDWPQGLSAVFLDVYQTWRRHSSGLPNPLVWDCSKKHMRVRKKKHQPGGSRVVLTFTYIYIYCILCVYISFGICSP